MFVDYVVVGKSMGQVVKNLSELDKKSCRGAFTYDVHDLGGRGV